MGGGRGKALLYSGSCFLFLPRLDSLCFRPLPFYPCDSRAPPCMKNTKIVLEIITRGKNDVIVAVTSVNMDPCSKNHHKPTDPSSRRRRRTRRSRDGDIGGWIAYKRYGTLVVTEKRVSGRCVFVCDFVFYFPPPLPFSLFRWWGIFF